MNGNGLTSVSPFRFTCGGVSFVTRFESMTRTIHGRNQAWRYASLTTSKLWLNVGPAPDRPSVRTRSPTCASWQRRSGLIASAQKVEHYEIAAYGCLRTYAQLLGYDEAVRLLEQILADEEAADKKLTELARGASTRQRLRRARQAMRSPTLTTNRGPI